MYVFSDDEAYWSSCEEFSTLEGCKEAANDYFGCGVDIFIGEKTEPVQPEGCFSAYRWLEDVSDQEDYCIEAAEDWDNSTKEQRLELEKEVSEVMSKWLDKYKLRPKFFIVKNIIEYTTV